MKLKYKIIKLETYDDGTVKCSSCPVYKICLYYDNGEIEYCPFKEVE